MCARSRASANETTEAGRPVNCFCKHETMDSSPAAILMAGLYTLSLSRGTLLLLLFSWPGARDVRSLFPFFFSFEGVFLRMGFAFSVASFMRCRERGARCVRLFADFSIFTRGFKALATVSRYFLQNALIVLYEVTRDKIAFFRPAVHLPGLSLSIFSLIDKNPSPDSPVFRAYTLRVHISSL